MKDGGKTIKQMVKDDLFMLMVMCMTDNGLMIRLMGLGYIIILTELNMRDSGKRISNTVMGK